MSVNRLVVIHIRVRELILPYPVEIIVKRISVGEHTVKILAVELLSAYRFIRKAYIGTVLHPNAVYISQEPRTRNSIASEVYPKLLALLCSEFTHITENINPLFPSVGHNIHILITARRVSVPFTAASFQHKAVKLPIVYVKAIHIIKEKQFNIANIFFIRNTDVV